MKEADTIKTTPFHLKIPATLMEINGECLITVAGNPSLFISPSTIGSGSTPEEAEKTYLEGAHAMAKFYMNESKQLSKWALFQCGPWKHGGGRWFAILGIHVFFRYGKGMKGGFYIPLTKLNISITNSWKRPKTKTV